MELIQRTLIECRRRGWYAVKEGVTEVMTNRRQRRDFLGVIDLIVWPDELYCLALQVTSASNHAARVKKALDNPHLQYWLRSGNFFEVWSWRQAKNGRWSVREQEIQWNLRESRLLRVSGPTTQALRSESRGGG
jgi:hypothetical protein